MYKNSKAEIVRNKIYQATGTAKGPLARFANTRIDVLNILST